MKYVLALCLLLAGATNLSAQSYNWYFGTMHTHSAYSDGDMDNACIAPNSPTCCYTTGNGAQNFDFMGIADHNHNEGPVMSPSFYLSGVNEAVTYTTGNPGFVAMYGMEWGTISTGGHVWIYGIDSLVGWNASNYHIYCAKGDYTTLTNIINARPGAFASICHPNSGDYNNINGAAYNASYDQALIGVAVRNGPYASTNLTYSDPPAANTVAFYNTLLSKGYHVGPTVDMDNHNSATMGRTSEGRTVVVASSLTRNDIYSGYRAMRFYASDDYNCRLTFTESTTNWMGSILTANYNPQLAVTVNDLGGEATTQIRILYGVPGSGAAPTQLTANTNSNTLSFTHTIATGATYYYYAEITQADGDKMWTAPIWFTKNLPLATSGFELFYAIPTDEAVALSWKFPHCSDGESFTIQRSTDGITFEDAGTLTKQNDNKTYFFTYQDHLAATGWNTYRIRYAGMQGESFSPEQRVYLAPQHTALTVEAFPNPGDGHVTVRYFATEGAQSWIYITDLEGRTVAEINSLATSTGMAEQSLHLDELPAGAYVILVKNDAGESDSQLYLKE